MLRPVASLTVVTCCSMSENIFAGKNELVNASTRLFGLTSGVVGPGRAVSGTAIQAFGCSPVVEIVRSRREEREKSRRSKMDLIVSGTVKRS